MNPVADPLTHVPREVLWLQARDLLSEAELLDDRRWDEWLELLDDDFEYVLPMPVTRDNPALPAYDEKADILRRAEGGGWKLARRRVYLDQNLPTWQMRLII